MSNTNNGLTINTTEENAGILVSVRFSHQGSGARWIVSGGGVRRFVPYRHWQRGGGKVQAVEEWARKYHAASGGHFDRCDVAPVQNSRGKDSQSFYIVNFETA